eukprot:6213725-Pleurochrysis_carterae.AAC.2
MESIRIVSSIQVKRCTIHSDFEWHPRSASTVPLTCHKRQVRKRRRTQRPNCETPKPQTRQLKIT